MHLDHLPGTFFGPSNLVELLLHRARCQSDDIAFTYLVDGENEQVHLTYKELDRQARAIGAWLEAQDLAGERALLLYPPGLEFIAAFFGCVYGGVIAVPVY
ncbi:MAG TPA: AMP-binding protein, partial [Thermoguttaceae bacterium]